MYTVLYLTNESRRYLEEYTKKILPKGWKIEAHHMTIDFNFIDEDAPIGEMMSVVATHIGRNRRAMALKVEGYQLKDKRVPHVTLAYSIRVGSAKDSNTIKTWKPIVPIVLEGRVCRIPKSHRFEKIESCTLN